MLIDTRLCSNTVQTIVAERETSKSSQSSSAFVFPDTAASMRDLIEAWGYSEPLNSKVQTEIGERLGMFLRGKPYSRSYVVNILAGRPLGEEVRVGILNLLAIADGARVEQVKARPVQCITECNVHPGAFILASSRLCKCGVHFVPRAWNQLWHSQECKKKLGKR